MDDDPKKQLMPLLAFTALVGAAYLGLRFFGPEPEEAPISEQAEANVEASASSASSEGEGSSRPSAADMEARRANAETATIETDKFIATFTNLNASISSFRVKGERFREADGELHEMVSTDKERYLPGNLVLGGITIPEDAVWTMTQPAENVVRFELEVDGFVVARQWQAGESPYQLWSTVRIRNTGDTTRPVRVTTRTSHYVARDQESSSFMGRPAPEAAHAQCAYDEDEHERLDRGAVEDRPGTEASGFSPAADWAGLTNQYFATLIASDTRDAERCQIWIGNRWTSESAAARGDDPHGTLFTVALRGQRIELEGGADTLVRTPIYMGPKDLDAMHAFGHRATEAVDLGWFTFIAEGLVLLLRTIHGYVGNWGLAIVLLTFLVKLLLYPLTAASFKNMARMSELKPHLDALNEKYGDDREAKGQATMELYRKHKINPFAGCLPMLLQMPIWFALYQSLSTNLELYHAPFALFWTDLSARDPYFVLPLMLGGLMFVQQKLTPTATMDPTQAKIMLYFMPIMITGIMLFLPAGLCIYMVTNSVLSITQQHVIRRRLAAQSSDDASAPAS